MAERKIQNLSPDRLCPYTLNARTHSTEQIDRICRVIQQVGFINPIVVDENNVILAGHGRWEAAFKLGLKTVPTIVVRGLTEARKRAYRLADNRVAERAGWDRKKLAQDINELSSLLDDAGLDVELTGFEAAEIDL